jgi:hypothetical protein
MPRFPGPRDLWSALLRGPAWAVGAVGALGPGAFGWPAAIGMGAGVGLFSLFEPRFAQGITKRRALMDWMRPALLSVLTATLTVLVIAVILAALRRRRDPTSSLLESYLGSLRRLSPVVALPLVVALREPLESGRGWLTFGFIVTAAVLAAHATYQWQSASGSAISDSRVGGLLAGLVVGVSAVAYALAEARVSIMNHRSLNTGRFDLGNYVSLFREASEGRPLHCSLCLSGHLPVSHFEPFLALLSPVYRAYPTAECLLVLQAAWLAAGAVPVYLLTRHHARHRGAAAALAIAYLAHPALHSVGLSDFHSVALAVPLILWLLLALELGAARAYFALAVATLLVREDMPVVIAGVGLFALFSGDTRRARMGGATLLLAGAYLLSEKALAHVGPLSALSGQGWKFFRDELLGSRAAGAPGELPGRILPRVLTEAKVFYVAGLVLPLLGVPLLGRGRVLLVYGSAVVLLGASASGGALLSEQAALLVPFLFALAASALGRVRAGELGAGGLSGPRLSRALALGILVASLLSSWKFGGLVQNGGFRTGGRALGREPTTEQRATAEWLRKLGQFFPRGAKVAASNRLLPHLGRVSHLYVLDDRGRTDYVVAAMKNPSLAKIIGVEEAKGSLVQIDAYADIRVYRTQYHRGARPVPRPLEDD